MGTGHYSQKHECCASSAKLHLADQKEIRHIYNVKQKPKALFINKQREGDWRSTSSCLWNFFFSSEDSFSACSFSTFNKDDADFELLKTLKPSTVSSFSKDKISTKVKSFIPSIASLINNPRMNYQKPLISASSSWQTLSSLPLFPLLRISHFQPNSNSLSGYHYFSSPKV